VGLQTNPDLVRRLALNESFEVSFLADAGGERSGRRLSVTMLPESTGYTYDDIGPTFHIFPVGPITSQLSTFNCRLIDPHRIDLSVVGLWLGRSEEKHKNSYDNIRGVNTKADQVFWTIDVRNKRLRRTSRNDRFIALSYVLGDTTVSPFVATAEEFFALVDKGISLQDALEKQPRTIADAMLIVLDIGETLLWVDALCMPPSAKHRAGQIAFMDQIYGSAAPAIVAANGDSANCGLSGVRSGTRALDQIVEQVGPSLALAVELPHTIDAVTKAPWNNQGWTYQERLLSKRLLTFANETIF
jgi:Heterokaryon incompatibility protein (HET)